MNIKDVLVLIEDRRFYSHHGVDLIGILRAILVNFQEGRLAQGGSTITQQLARTLYLSSNKTIRRKIAEVAIAFWLEIRMTKDQILDLYVKSIYMGHVNGRESTGIHEACSNLFGKDLSEINVSETAQLIAMVRGPNLYVPGSPAGIARKVLILSRMLAENMIDRETFLEASRSSE